MKKPKVTVELPTLEKKLKKIVRKMKKNKFGETIVREIVNKIRKDSFRFKTGKRFRKLTPSTIEIRKDLAKYNSTHPNYNPTKPNLTFTGRLLDSIKSRIQAKRSSIVMRIDVSGMHAPYKYKGLEMGKPQKNKTIRKNLAKIGRDPLELSKKATKRLTRIFKAIIKEQLK
tara:strand:- start:3197 stop:3709 length:513 start_codon:yes stop_codon:yes gene_type:complete